MRRSELLVGREGASGETSDAGWRLLSGMLIFLLSGLCAYSQQSAADFFSGLQWRLVGPHRAGRVTAVAGIAGNPAIYYMGTPGGGVWKTTDGGVVWRPIFDDMHVASIGALALAPSNPDVIYVGTGEQTDGTGVYKSTDAGLSWGNVGLAESHAITSLLVDPKDPNVVLVGAFGEAWGDATPSPGRGVFKSTDGGKSWRKVFFKDDHTGIRDMCFDPHDSRVVYASVQRVNLGPEEKKPGGPDSDIYKSTDKGETWKPVGQSGLPAENRGRIGVAVTAGNKGKRVFAIMNQGLFRSDDAGANWTAISSDSRVIGSGYFSRVFADPKDPDLVYVMQTTVYRSKDGGKTFAAFKGAPSGEDHHVFWIAPDDPKRILLGSDQGATITVDGGESWSIWFNQPTGQFYHLSTDNSFPYHLYAAQQDSGSIVVPNRSDFGEITYRDWYPSGAFESGNIAADPVNANFVYSVGWFGTVLRLDRTTNQVATIFVPPSNYRTAWETPLVLSARDPHAMYYGAQFVLKTADGGATWAEISPDLTAKTKAAAEMLPALRESGNRDPDEEEPQARDRGVIQTIAVSPVDAKTVWVGTSGGLMQLTRDESTWQDVTPADLPDKSFVNLVEASPSDVNTAYAAVMVRRDRHPYFYRTRDAGKSWQKIVNGLAESGIARVVREDPARPGLLYAGTETGAYVSFDRGDHWQSLQLNLPTTSVRDLQVHGNDLVAATFGRGLWIIDDVALLRQISSVTPNSGTHFFLPETALRVRWDNHPDTPLSAETPAGRNPPEGAIIDYFLNAAPKGEVTLEVLDASGHRVQRFSSVAPPQGGAPANVPEYWFAAPAALPAKPGANRFAWDLRYPPPTALTYGYYGERLEYTEYTLPDHAIPGETPRYQPQGPLVVPGKYQLVLTVDGQSYRQPLQVELDPRVQVSQADLVAQLDLAKKLAAWMDRSAAAFNRVIALHGALKEKKKLPENAAMPKDLASAAAELDKQLSGLEDGNEAAPGFGPLNRNFGRYLTMIESGDYRPGESAHKAAGEACESFKKNISLWNKLIAEGMPALNKSLEQAKLTALPLATALTELSCAN
jgi:photosystem II stability/assembly factor-like uncharacterized protein